MSAHGEATAEPLPGSRGGQGPPADDEAFAIDAVPLRHWGRWISAAIILFVLFALLWSLWHNPNIDIATIRDNLFAPYVLRGVVVTIELTIIAMVVGLVGGMLLAVMRLSQNPVLKTVAWGYIWFFRGTPILVQILFWGFVGALYPKLFIGLPFTGIVFADVETSRLIGAFAAAILALGLNEAAYAAELVRAGIISVDRGQYEAASLPRHVGRPHHAPHRAAPGDARHHPADGQRDHLHAQDHVARRGHLRHRSDDRYPAGLLAELQDDPAAAGGQHLVSRLTSIMSIGQYYLERHFGRGFGARRGRRRPRSAPSARDIKRTAAHNA